MHRLLIGGALGALLLAGCGADPAADADPHAGHDHGGAPEAEAGPSNRTPIPPVVRRNLGLTFAEAQYRPVAATITVPGHFELLPSAQHHYPLPARGRVTVLVEPLEQIAEGQLLLRLDSPAWRDLQRDLVDARTARLQAQADLAKARAAKAAAGDLTGSGGADFDVYDADIQAAEAAVAGADERLVQLVAQASTLTGISQDALRVEENGKPAWRRLETIPIRAVDAGVVREVDAATGTWVAEGTEVVHVVHPSTLRFRGTALQADLIDDLRDGQSVRIGPPEGKGPDRRGAAVTGSLRLGVSGDPETRTVDIFVDVDADELQPWMRPEVAALAEVAVAGDPDLEELAIPVRAVIQDGLETVFFRRDPDDPDAVIRTEADLGPSDGRWVTVYSGLAEGDEVVVDGVYQLKLATTGQDVKAGHFHADGTFHEGED